MSDEKLSLAEGKIGVSDRTIPAANWSVVACGDWAPTGKHIETIRQSPSHLYTDLLPILRSADLSLVNVECVFTNGGTHIIKDGPPLKTPVEMTEGLTIVPFSVACLANNHIMDFGEAGLSETLGLLEQYGIPAIGAGLTLEEARKPFLAQLNGVKIAILNVGEGEEGVSRGGAGVAPLDMEHIRQQIAELRQTSDVVLVVAHAGREHLPFPAPYIQATYRSIMEMGATAVIAHHPHSPQGIETYCDGIIAYSLGNFVFGYGNAYLWAQLGYMLRVNFSGSQFHSADIIPYRILDDRLTLLENEEKIAFLKHLERVSAFLNETEQIKTLWDAIADLWVQQLMPDEMSIWTGLLSAPDLLKATRLLAMTRADLKTRIIRRLILMLERWLRRTSTTPSSSEESRQRGAAVLRNRFDTLAHRELYLTAMERIVKGQVGNVPAWTTSFLQDWYSIKTL